MAQQPSRASAIFDPQNPASPLSIPFSKTALLLLDYHGFTVHTCGSPGLAAVQKAADLRDWAATKGILIIHGLVDVKRAPSPHYKGAERYKGDSAMLAKPGMVEEHPDVAPTSESEAERTVFRQPGKISALKSDGIMEILAEKGVKSLIVADISTSGCVLRTVCAAADEDFVVTVVEDACVDPVPGMHESLCRDVLTSQAHVVTVGEVKEEWEKVK